MAFIHSKNTRVSVNEKSFSGVLNSISTGSSTNMGDVTVFLSEGTEYIKGLNEGSLSLGGLFEPTAHGDISSALSAGDDALRVLAAPAGFAIGNPVFMAYGEVSGYAADASVADPVSFSVEAQPNDGVDLGVSLHDLTAETATVNSASVDNAVSSAGGGVAMLSVTAASGTSPTLSAIVQHSADNSVWVDLVTMTTATAATSERKRVSGTVNRYTRVRSVIGGTTPSFTFAVAFARR